MAVFKFAFHFILAMWAGGAVGVWKEKTEGPGIASQLAGLTFVIVFLLLTL